MSYHVTWCDGSKTVASPKRAARLAYNKAHAGRGSCSGAIVWDDRKKRKLATCEENDRRIVKCAIDPRLKADFRHDAELSGRRR